MPSFGKRYDVPGGKRRVVRERVLLAGSAASLYGTRSVVIDDVCSTGARLRGRDLPSVGQQMVFKVGTADILASVAWSHSEECGITFDTPLEPVDVQELKIEGCLGRVMGIL